LNSSILALRLRISGVIWMVSVFSTNQFYTHLHPISVLRGLRTRKGSCGKIETPAGFRI
jgi:hypothetical protein